MYPTYSPQAGSENPWQLGPTAGRIARWVFGLGFFSVHLGVFLIGGLALLMINLYRSPDDLWIGGPLVRWGIVVVIHFLGAVVTWALTTAFDAAEATRRDAMPTAAPLPRVYTPVVPARPVPAVAAAPPGGTTAPRAPRSRFRPDLSTPIETVEGDQRRRFGVRSRIEDVVPPPVEHRTSPPGWTVMRSESAPGHVAPVVIPAPPPTPAATPAVEAASDDAGDSRWTWVEAAAEAWLADRLDRSGDSPPGDGEAS